MPLNRRQFALSLAAGVLVVAGVSTVVQSVRQAEPTIEASSRATRPASADAQTLHTPDAFRQAHRGMRRATYQALRDEGVITDDTPREEARRLVRERLTQQAAERGEAVPQTTPYAY